MAAFVLILVSIAAINVGMCHEVEIESKQRLLQASNPVISVKAALEEVEKLSDLAYSELLGGSFDHIKLPAVDDCLALFKYTIRQLNESVASLTKFSDWTKQRSDDVQTWLSASLTDQHTCLHGFEGLDEKNSGSLLPNRVRSVYELISNCLAIAKSMALISPGRNNRRLLFGPVDSDPFSIEDGYPTWLSAADRRLLQASPFGFQADVVVAQDGTGNFKTISDAVKAAPSRRNGRYIIHVKAGVYDEMIDVSKDNIMLVGDGKDVTVVAGSKSGESLKSIATFAATGKGFIARDMGFRNAAGPWKGQAIALRVVSDKSAFYRCSMKSYQDTLYAYSQRQFYRECDIYGTVDFIFGNAAAVFQSCNIVSMKAGRGSANYITAQGRTDPNQNTGFSIHNSKVTGAVKTYLGRPWREYSRTVYMQSNLDGSIDPAGWAPWEGNFALKTLFYGEYMNTGAGASTSKRVKWAGYHIITSVEEATQFTVAQLISGNSWLPSTGVAFQAGLNA